MKRLLFLLLLMAPLCAKKGDIFVVIEPPKAIKDDIASIQKQLKKSWSSNEITFHKPDELHITVQFIGNKKIISGKNYSKVLKAVEDAAKWLKKKDPTFGLTKDKIAGATFKVWPSHSVFVFPRSNTMTELAKKIRSNLEASKVPYDSSRMDFPDKMHISIARFDKKSKPEMPKGKFKLSKNSFPVRKISLKKSVYEKNKRYETPVSYKIS